MAKEVVVGVLAALVTAAAFWILGLIGKIPDVISVPSGAVVAFNAKSCPDSGWREYKAVYGRFIRGIDRSSDSIDPQGERTPGSLQGAEIQAHTHGYVWMKGDNNVDGVDSATTGSGEHHNESNTTLPSGGKETRPKNVALLFCEKI